MTADDGRAVLTTAVREPDAAELDDEQRAQRRYDAYVLGDDL